MNRAVIALGSNIDPERHMALAKDGLSKGFSVILVSSFVWTKPLGPIAQADFLNGVVLLETSLGLPALRARLKQLELELGRKQAEKWGPREIDLDVIIFNNILIDEDYHKRDFLQAAVREILPQVKLRDC